MVVDEAHHAAGAQACDRKAYAKLGNVLAALGNPVALAVTATAASPVARQICNLLGIDDRDVVIDRTVRKNIKIVDYRELRDRDDMLTSLVARGQKTVVYVNSRSQTATLVRTLRKGAPDIGHKIAYYHAGLSRDVRHKIEEAFRDDRLSCIVCTSAFGEGVNLPGIRNVVLYHMPFGSTEFNQMSGRAGRDGKEANVFLLYGSRDALVNEKILLSQAPTRNDLAALYRALMTEDKRSQAQTFVLSETNILSCALSIDSRIRLTESAVSVGITIFEELGFCATQGFGTARQISMAHSPSHVDLSASLRYTEGQHAIEEFAAFRDWALTSLPQEMLNRINRPIAPSFGQTVDR